MPEFEVVKSIIINQNTTHVVLHIYIYSSYMALLENILKKINASTIYNKYTNTHTHTLVIVRYYPQKICLYSFLSLLLLGKWRGDKYIVTVFTFPFILCSSISNLIKDSWNFLTNWSTHIFSCLHLLANDRID